MKLTQIAASFCLALISLLPATGCVDDAGAPHSTAAAAATDKGTSMNTNANTNGISSTGYDIHPLPRETVAQLASKLDAEAYRVTQNAGTEAAFCGNLLDNKKQGTYACIVCGLPLFSSEHKFNSGTGWPSFYAPVDPAHVHTVVDNSLGMTRTEIDCARCTAHLGHVFEDGPKPTGLRYCLNSAALKFYDKGTLPPDALTKNATGLARGEAAAAAAGATAAAAGAAGVAAAAGAAGAPAAAGGSAAAAALETAYFAGGCFWGIEHWFEICPGVKDAESGFMGGKTTGPSYKQVCAGDTGHAEVVKVVFDPSKVTYRQLVEGFFIMHDPTQLNRQGPDVGEQYRSAIFTTSAQQRATAQSVIEALTAARAFGGKKIVTQLLDSSAFTAADASHQDYIQRTGAYCHGSNPWPQVFGGSAPATSTTH